MALFPLSKRDKPLTTFIASMGVRLSMFACAATLLFIYTIIEPVIWGKWWVHYGKEDGLSSYSWLYVIFLIQCLWLGSIERIDYLEHMVQRWIRLLLTLVLLPAALAIFALNFLSNAGPGFGVTAAVCVWLGYYFIGALFKENAPSAEADALRGVKLGRQGGHTSKGALEVFWGGALTKTDEPHFLVTGTTGSGKTLTIAMLLRSVYAQRAQARRLIAFDSKYDTYPMLLGLGIAEKRVHLLNPFDERGKAWDIAADITSDNEALQMAALMVPASPASDPFWAESARGVLAAVMFAMNQVRPSEWDLFDLCELFQEPPEILKALLYQTRSGQAAHRKFLEVAPKTAASILAQLGTRMQYFAPAARSWRSTKNGRISLKEWAEQGLGALVLAVDDSRSEGLVELNGCMFEVLSRALSQRQDNPGDTTWVVADELTAAGRLAGLERLLTRGRSKGVHAVLGFQDVQGVQHVYKEQLANTLLGQCGNKALLRLESAEAREWASRHIGSREHWRESTSFTLGQSNSSSTSQSIHVSRSIMPEEFFAMPATGPGNGLPGVYTCASEGVWRHTIKWSSVLRMLPAQVDESGFIERLIPDSDELHWTEHDHELFNLLDAVDPKLGDEDVELEVIQRAEAREPQVVLEPQPAPEPAVVSKPAPKARPKLRFLPESVEVEGDEQ